MARRRMISQELIFDEHFNSLSLQAQNIFVRLLSVSDDYGVVPANHYTLNKLINTPKRVSLQSCLEEIIAAGMGAKFNYGGTDYFIFKRDRFDDYQSYVIAKRTKSEYLRLPKDFMDSEKFQEILRNSRDVGTTSIESNKQKVESRKHRVESSGKSESVEEVIIFCKDLKIPQADAEYLWHKWEGNGWTNGGKAIKDWKATVRSWQKAGYLPSQKNNTQRASPSSASRTLEKCEYCGERFANVTSHWDNCPKYKPASPERVKEIMQNVNLLADKFNANK